MWSKYRPTEISDYLSLIGEDETVKGLRNGGEWKGYFGGLTHQKKLGVISALWKAEIILV